jgi:hypothetical protein
VTGLSSQGGPPAPVLLTGEDVALGEAPSLVDLATEAALVDGSAEHALKLASQLADVALPGGGATVRRWETLATLGAHDLTAARVCEVQLDALAILAEAATAGFVPVSVLDAAKRETWGVFAAEGPAGRLRSVGQRAGDDSGGGSRLDGVKPWCSLAGSLSRALVTAFEARGGRRLYAIDLTDPSVDVEPAAWVSRGLADVPSGPIACRHVAATPVGPTGWYLDRPGFWWGGIGVAACWYGGAVGLARRLQQGVARAVGSDRPPDQLAYAAIGRVDACLHAARATLSDAAAAADSMVDRDDAREIALRARAVVANAVDIVLTTVGHAMGPAPLTFDDWHARHVADLQVYVRQHHAERDDALLGQLVAAGPALSL